MNILLALLNLLLATITTLGAMKYFIEPRIIAQRMRRKYATALWIACCELKSQLVEIQTALTATSQGYNGICDALLKIPRYDSGNRLDWFTKDGYYASVTAYKIAAVSCWLSIYKDGLLLSPYLQSRKFLSGLYNASDDLARAFGNNTIFWRDYFLSLGNQLMEKDEANEAMRAMPFSRYCSKVHSDENFRYYLEQVHMFLWSLSNQRNSASVTIILNTPAALRKYLEQENIVDGLVIKAAATNPNLWAHAPESLRK